MFIELLLILSTVFRLHYATPNFIIFFVDDMGYGDLSYTGHPTIHTPHIDYWAHRSKRFTQWYSAYHICTGSRASLLTGRHPVRSGMCGPWYGEVLMPGAIGGLDPNTELTFTKILKQQHLNYATKIIGKWHLGVGSHKQFLPFNHGFDEFLGIPHSTNQGKSPWDYRYPNVLPLIDNDTIIEQPPDLSTLTSRFTSEAISFIRDSVYNNNSSFLLYMSYLHSHVPDFTSQSHCNTSLRGRYGDAMRDLDHSFGEIMSFITADELIYNDTIIFFTSDNGPWLNKSIAGGSASLFSGGKWTTWEGGIRMPAFVHWNNKIQRHSVSYQMVSTLDIFPTVIALAGGVIPTDRYIDGKDMTQLLLGKTDGELHECLYFYGGTTNAGCHKYESCPGLWAIRCGSYKAHWVTRYSNWTLDDGATQGPIIRNPPLLYNVDQDPSETFGMGMDTELYREVMEYMTNKRKDMENTVDYEGIINQIELGVNQEYVLCCDPLSQMLYPEYPRCTCNPQNWQQFVCEPICLGLGTCT